MRIVVLDGYTLNPGDNPWDALARLGDLEVYERSGQRDVVARASGAEIVVTNKTPLDGGTIGRLSALRFVSVLATGYDVVDYEAAAARGIAVSNVPAYATESVAQHVFALLLELASRVGEHARAVRDGEWTRSPDFCFWHDAPVELYGLTMGVVGLGRIGRRVASLARAFGMDVVATTRSSTRVEAVEILPLPDLLARADVVSLHCPANAETEGLIGRTALAAMKPSAFLVNTARGALVEEAALADALANGRLAGAALDVVSVEPMRADNPLLGAPRCVVTPHMAWASLAARRRLMDATVANVAAFLAGDPINRVA